jgi:hypothetical protein
MPQLEIRLRALFLVVQRAWRVWICALAFSLAVAVSAVQAAESLPAALATLQKVGHEAAGNRAATKAWAVVAAADARQLPTMLAALDDAGPLAANYLRTAIEAVAERTLAQGQELPQVELEQYVLDRTHSPRSRQLAFEWLAKVDPTAPDRLTPKFLNDPSLELRRQAVERLFQEGSALIAEAANDQRKTKAGIATLRRAFDAARSLDQIAKLDKELTKLNEQVDLVQHFGFVTSWRLIGPFDNRNGIGFDAVYPPEETVDFAAQYEGKTQKVSWIAHTTTDREGKVDLNLALGKDMGCVAYAASEFYSPHKQDVELRFGSVNASKLWVNGQLIARHRIYHTGAFVDQYQSRATLRPGRNVILLKMCQNEQTQKWAQVWEFQFRVCDAIGTAIHSAAMDATNPQPPVKN